MGRGEDLAWEVNSKVERYRLGRAEEAASVVLILEQRTTTRGSEDARMGQNLAAGDGSRPGPSGCGGKGPGWRLLRKESGEVRS